jgi:hypothetical protein
MLPIMNKTPKKAERFPLWLHPRGQRRKKHRGQFYYFGSDREETINRYGREWDDIQAGRHPKANPADPTKYTTLADVVNPFHIAKRKRFDIGEVTFRQWSEYKMAGEARHHPGGQPQRHRPTAGRIRKGARRGRNAAGARLPGELHPKGTIYLQVGI